MSGQEDKVVIHLSATGAADVKKDLREVSKETAAVAPAAEKASKTAQSRFNEFGKCLNDNAKKLRNLVTGFGGFSIVSQALNNYKQAFTHVLDTISKKNDYIASTLSGNTANAVKKLAEEYDRLKESITAVNEAMAHGDKLTDIRLANIRKQQDAELDLAEEREISALAADDPDRQLKETAIRARYSERRTAVSGKRSGEDTEKRAARLDAEAASLDKASQDAQSMLPDIAAQRTESQQLAEKALKKAGKWSNSFWSFLTPVDNQGEKWAKRAQGNIDNVTALNEQEMQIMRDNEARQQRAARLREEAAAVRESAAPDAAASNVEQTRASRATQSAQTAVTAAAASRAEDERKRAQATAELEQKRAARSQIEQQRKQAQEAAQREEQEAWRAQNTADAARLTMGNKAGTRRGRAQLAALDAAAKREAEEANTAARHAGAVMEQTASALKEMDSGISKLEATIKTLNRRLNTAKGDALAAD